MTHEQILYLRESFCFAVEDGLYYSSNLKVPKDYWD